MSNQNSETSPAFQQAVAALQRGDTVAAEEIITTAAHEARAKYGPGSPEDAVAQNELGNILINVGQLPRAIAAYREATSGPWPEDKQAQRDQLTFLMNLGMALQWHNQLEEAEEALRRGLKGREDFYGKQHAGYAFGLEPLAEVLLRRGKLDEAVQLAEEALRNFWNNGHERVVTALVLRAEAWKAAKKEGNPLAPAAQLPDHLLQQLADHVYSRVGRTDVRLSWAVLNDLVPLLEARFGEAHEVTLGALSVLANVGRGAGEPEARLATIRRFIQACDRWGRPEKALQGVQGLALALSEAKQHEAAGAAYRDALQRADRLGDAAQKSQVRRNFGLFLAEQERRGEAEPKLREAVAEAERARDKEMLGRAEIALGIFLQHGGKLDEARDFTARGVSRLAPSHPDAVSGRSHLKAIESGDSCGCGNTGEAMAEALREFVLSRVPEGLLDRLEVKWENNNFAIQVYLNREPSQQEVEHLGRIIQHAQEDFRKRVTQPH
ncbi:MAG TPA: tetratricopeptide repeat protein [Gemmataceae bacterium]|nr:tetratricopeptide repeat protein [Gemmataceae bacterium]